AFTETVAKADATINVSDYTGTYDGHAHGLTGTAVGVQGEDLGSELNLGSTQTNAGNTTVTWTFAGDSNYNSATSTANINIAKATANVTVGDCSTYDDHPPHATGRAAGVAQADLRGEQPNG